MSAKVDAQSHWFDGLKWLVVAILVAAGVVGNAYFGQWPLLYRVLALVGLGLVAVVISINTAKGAALATTLRESFVEVRKVVWPTRAETNQTTLVVVAAVLLMAVLLWALDSLLGWLASLIIG